MPAIYIDIYIHTYLCVCDLYAVYMCSEILTFMALNFHGIIKIATAKENPTTFSCLGLIMLEKLVAHCLHNSYICMSAHVD